MIRPIKHNINMKFPLQDTDNADYIEIGSSYENENFDFFISIRYVSPSICLTEPLASVLIHIRDGKRSIGSMYNGIKRTKNSFLFYTKLRKAMMDDWGVTNSKADNIIDKYNKCIDIMLQSANKGV